MEEKKIIGQECEFYDEGHCLCYSDESHYPHCLEYPNCYYKQLQLKDKMIERVLIDIQNYCKNAKQLTCSNRGCCQVGTCEDIEIITKQALAELEE